MSARAFLVSSSLTSIVRLQTMSLPLQKSPRVSSGLCMMKSVIPEISVILYNGFCSQMSIVFVSFQIMLMLTSKIFKSGSRNHPTSYCTINTDVPLSNGRPMGPKSSRISLIFFARPCLPQRLSMMLSFQNVTNFSIGVKLASEMLQAETVPVSWWCPSTNNYCLCFIYIAHMCIQFEA